MSKIAIFSAGICLHLTGSHFDMIGHSSQNLIVMVMDQIMADSAQHKQWDIVTATHLSELDARRPQPKCLRYLL